MQRIKRRRTQDIGTQEEDKKTRRRRKEEDEKGSNVHKREMQAVPLDDIIGDNVNKDACEELCKQLKENGWCFVRLPTNKEYKSLTPSSESMQQLDAFFATELPKKSKYSAPLSFGYFQVKNLKEGMHLYTGTRISAHKTPKKLSSLFKEWAKSCDKLAVELVYALARPLFDSTPPVVYREAGLPLSQASEQIGLLDIARYFNTKTITPVPETGSSTEDVNCVPHYDPGLLSISFYSNTPGLQLLDHKTKKWIDGPINSKPEWQGIAVIWTGEAAVRASKGTIKPGTHRVVYPSDEPAIPRIGIWYEMATIKQINSDYDQLNSLEGVSEVVVENALTSGGPGARVKVKPGDTKYDVFRKIEKHYGMPSIKSGRMSIVRSKDAVKLFNKLTPKEQELYQQGEKHLASTWNR